MNIPENDYSELLVIVLSDKPQLLRFRSEEHTSELQSRTLISYAVFCLKKKKEENHHYHN